MQKTNRSHQLVKTELLEFGNDVIACNAFLVILRTDTNFPRNPRLLAALTKLWVSIIQITIFITIFIGPWIRLQKPLFIPRTHTNFPGASIFSSNRLFVFQEALSSQPLMPRTDAFSGDCFRRFKNGVCFSQSRGF